MLDVAQEFSVPSPFDSPVVVDGVLSDERLAQLLALQTEYPELDYKESINLQDRRATAELAKDVGAMQVRGGYIVVGVDDNGSPTGGLDEADLRPFDEASLTQKVLRYLPEPLVIRSRVAEYSGHRIVAIFVGPHPDGCAFFKANGTYQDDAGREQTVFREGDVYWRDGTRSTRLTQTGHREVVARQVAAAKADWMTEQRDLRQREREDHDAAAAAERPLGTVNLDMRPRELSVAALEFVRGDDPIGLHYLINEAAARARQYIDAGQIEDELGALLDRLICMAATFLEYGQTEWFERIIELLKQIYAMPLTQQDVQRFAYNVHISPEEPAPRVFLQLMTRLYALGALAVRRRKWAAVRTLTLQLPDPIREFDYENNWLRNAMTTMSRAQHLVGEQEGRTVELNLLSLAQEQAARLDCLRPDGIAADDDELLTSLTQFDILTNLVAVADSPDDGFGRTFYPNFARWQQDRIQAFVQSLLTTMVERTELGLESDELLARALQAVGQVAAGEGMRYFGFMGWNHTPVGAFITEHLPAE